MQMRFSLFANNFASFLVYFSRSEAESCKSLNVISGVIVLLLVMGVGVWAYYCVVDMSFAVLKTEKLSLM